MAGWTVDARHKFCALITIEQKSYGFAREGDSGALVFDEDGDVAGMLVAATDTVAYAVPIADVLDEAKVTLALP